MKAVVQNCFGTTAEWTSANPRLYKGAFGIEATPEGKLRFKAGDGKRAWQELPYMDVEFVSPGDRTILERVTDLENSGGPAAGSPPTEDGTYTLHLTIAGGVKAYAWM
jgi:hypothetical protein